MTLPHRFVLAAALLVAPGSLLSVFAQTNAAKTSGPPALPPGVTAHRDLAYVSQGHERQKLDLYVPANSAGPFPVIAWVHGGGWAAGDKRGCPPLFQGFVARGYAVVSIGYRLSGDALFPAQLEDCKAALRWLRAHAKEYRLDGQHIGVWGSSAGGHLVTLLGTSGDAKEFDVGEHLDQSSRVQAVCDYYGPTDFRQMDAHAIKTARMSHNAPDSPEARLLGGAIQDPAMAEKVRRANPITYLDPKDPPFLIVHGDADPTVPHHQSELLYAAAVKAGVPAHVVTILGGGHGAGFPTRELQPLVAGFFARHLQGDESAAPWPAARRSELKALTPEASATQASPNPAAPAAPARAGPPPWNVLLQRNDADHDGRLSRSEFKGPPALFNRLDTNQDGFLSQKEHEAFLGATGRDRSDR